MTTTTNFVQLPPDGVGKKIRHRVSTDLKVTTVTNVPTIGTVLYGSTSNALGILTGIYAAEDTTFYLKEVSGTFVVGEILRNGTNTQNFATIATVNQGIHIPTLNIADTNIPEYTLTVDKRGAALTSFPEGTPQFDGWGRQQLSQLQAAGEYYYFVQDLAGKYYTATSGSFSSVRHNPASSTIEYVTGTGSSDYARRTTAQYHPFKPGISQLIYTTVAVSDQGKANVVREWGYFDDFNGFGFRLDGVIMKVFYRTDISGTPTDIEVAQADWNINSLNNASSSDFLLDVSQVNVYWMDIQGTGGRIRLGVETPDGRRITCHEFRIVNNIDGPSLRNITLPITWWQRNVGVVSTSPANTQSFRVSEGVVFTETADIKYTGVLIHLKPEDPVQLTKSDEYQPFLQFKAKNTVAGPTQSVALINPGFSYTIASVGNTDFTALGAPANVAGVKFTATQAGTGTGTAYMNIPNSIVGIHETFDWASSGNTNIHVGIFVLPNEKWINNVVWSETLQPGTMLYVDKNATEMAQYQYWSGLKATDIAGSISNGSGSAGNILTVTSLTGALLKEMYIVPSPQYPNGPLYIDGTAAYASTTGTVTDRTRVIKQLTGANGTDVASSTYGTQGSGQGVAGSNRIVLTSAAGFGQDHLISGTGIPAGTFVEAVDGNVITLSQAMTTTGTGTYRAFITGGPGTYRVDKEQLVESLTGYGGYLSFDPIESFMAPANSSGRAALGDRLEKSFGLGPVAAPEDAKGVFSFAAKLQTPEETATLIYTKYWKEIR